MVPCNAAKLMDDGRCYDCAVYADILRRGVRDPWKHVVVNGVYYVIADDEALLGDRRAFRGRKFILKRLSDGHITETCNLWPIHEATMMVNTHEDVSATIE